MIRLSGERLRTNVLDRHIYLCDLVNVEGPLLSLYRDNRRNWLYLWCDTDERDTDRWILVPATRSQLVEYLERARTLRRIVISCERPWILDATPARAADENEDEKGPYRYLRQINKDDLPTSYLPSTDSFFEPSLAPNVSLAQEFVPKAFDVHLDGDWFFADLDQFSNLYSQLYAFLYCSKPQFITSIGERVQKYLEAPWEGGYSRINLFAALENLVPSLHDLKIKGIAYSSPGHIRIEALKSVGERLANLLQRYLAHEDSVGHAVRALNTVLSRNHLRRANLAAFGDNTLPIPAEQREFLVRWTNEIARLLQLGTELQELVRRSPNIVVTAKVVIALVSRISKLATFAKIDLARL